MLNPLIDFFAWIMTICYQLIPNYWCDILIFTLFTKILLYPISLWCQKNSLTMVALMPKINRLKINYFGVRDKIEEESVALFKREHYHPMLSLVPLVAQIIILMALIKVIYKIASVSSNSLLASVPVTDGGISWIMPIAAGASAWLLGYCQNKINPLQREQTRIQQMMTNGISILISLSLGCFVGMGVGLYWAASNLFSILVQLCCNWNLPPKRYVNYLALYRTKIELKRLEAQFLKKISQEDKAREKADYKRFFKVANKHLVFYSEGSGFYKYFQSLMDYLLSHSNVVIHYVTNDPKDQIFKIAEKQPHIRPYFIGQMRIIPLMMKMDAEIVVMTTPDLDRFQLKRSYVRKDIEYIYLHHSLTSLNMCTREHAYDNYDTLFVSGPHQSAEIRKMEEMYQTKKKVLIPFGYGLLDNLLENYSKLCQKNTKCDKKQILVAPSHQEGNILDSCLETLLEKIMAPDRKIIVRPHPQYVRRYPARWKKILSDFADKANSNLVFETDFSSNETIYTSDILITDWSGIAYEFSFTTLHPSLFINTPMKVINPNYKATGIVPTDISFREQVGLCIEPEHVDKINEAVTELLTEQEKYSEKIRLLREKNLFNIGKCGEIGGKYILEQLIKRAEERQSKPDTH